MNKIILIALLVFTAILVEGFIEENPNEKEIADRLDEESTDLGDSDGEEPLDDRDETEDEVKLF